MSKMEDETFSENKCIIVTWSWRYSPKIIKRIIGDKFEISAIEKSGLNWEWPDRQNGRLYKNSVLLVK